MFARSLLLLIVVAIATPAATATAGPEVPGDRQQTPIALVGGTVHPVSGPAIENATVLFDQGQLVAIGKDVKLPAGTVTVDVKGKHVYPGLFDAYTNLGLVEINAVRATRDYRETGRLNPNVQAQRAVNPDSELIPVARSNGVLTALTAPNGGLVTGRSAVLNLDGWTWEDMTLKADAALHIRWPAMAVVSDWWVEETAKEQIESREKSLAELEQAVVDAQAYRRARAARGDAQPKDARWEAMLPVLAGEQPVIVEADSVSQIQAAVAFCARHKLRMILYGGYDAPRCAQLLKQHSVPVIIAGVYRLPRRRSDDYDASYTLPQRIAQAGLKYCISGAGRASNVRNLPYHAATAVAYGLPKDAALRAITLGPAEVLGVADRIGSLEAGKDATLIVTTGDPLETASLVVDAYIQGRKVDLSDRHKRLWKKYQEKYRRLDRDQK